MTESNWPDLKLYRNARMTKRLQSAEAQAMKAIKTLMEIERKGSKIYPINCEAISALNDIWASIEHRSRN